MERTLRTAYGIGLRAVPYFGVGFACHYLFVGDRIDPASSLFWAYLLVWPLMLAVKFALYAIGIIVACVVAICLFAWFLTWREGRRMRRRKPARGTVIQAGPEDYRTL